MKIVSFRKRKFLHLMVVAIFVFLILNCYEILARRKKLSADGDDDSDVGSIIKGLGKLSGKSVADMRRNDFQIGLSKERIDKLFRILVAFEDKFGAVFDELGVMKFKDLGNRTLKASRFQEEIGDYFKVSPSGDVGVNERFVDDLKYLSNYYSIVKPRDFVQPQVIASNRKPVIVTAANSDYYYPLEATVYFIHQNLPNYELIIYDLGLTSQQLDRTKSKCKCVIKRFDERQQYSNVASHVTKLKTYAWKPLIIQESLKEYDTVLYLDSSIRITTGKLEPILDTVSKTGLLSQFIGLKLLCYTNPKMFDWFQETDQVFKQMDTIEANFLIMNRNFLNSLIMKAWVTCALDEKCIAPENSRISGCCGCHRFDQDALTIVTTYFFGHPRPESHALPLYSFTKNESYFFNVRRHEGMPYFDGNL